MLVTVRQHEELERYSMHAFVSSGMEQFIDKIEIM
jgi:hypothetical protein